MNRSIPHCPIRARKLFGPPATKWRAPWKTCWRAARARSSSMPAPPSPWRPPLPRCWLVNSAAAKHGPPRRSSPSVPLRAATCRHRSRARLRRITRTGIEIAVTRLAVPAVPLREALAHDAEQTRAVLRDQFQPSPYAFLREVNAAEEHARGKVADLVRHRFIGNRIRSEEHRVGKEGRSRWSPS